MVSVNVVEENDDVIIGTRSGMAIRFPVTQVRVMGRPARGVRGINLRDDDRVEGAIRVEEGSKVLTVCENGYGKRTEVTDYRAQGRGGFGVIDIRTTDRNGPVVGILGSTTMKT